MVSSNRITLQMAFAGGQSVAACLDDPAVMSKANAPGEIAARCFRAMLEAAGELENMDSTLIRALAAHAAICQPVGDPWVAAAKYEAFIRSWITRDEASRPPPDLKFPDRPAPESDECLSARANH